MSEKLDYGQEISLTDANKIIKEHQDLDRILNKTVDASKITAKLKSKAEEFMKRKKNTFIFHKDLITRFFENEDKSLNAEYLVVVLGAHPDDMASTDDFKEGSFTVVTAGCKGYIDSNEELALRTLKLDMPANEYPPKITTAKLVSETNPIDNKIDTFIKFTLVQ